MNIAIDLQVAELLASRLCHDLVGPVGAVNNGLELLEDEDDAEMSREALNLAADSAERAAVALQYFRFAYGMAGSRVGGNLDELRDLSVKFLAKHKISVDWAVSDQAGELPEDLGKLLLNMVLLGAETLPMGGKVGVEVDAGAGSLEARVVTTGERAAARDDMAPALADDARPEDLTPRNVQAYFTRMVARRMGSDLALDTSAPGTVRLTVALAG